MSYWMLLLFLGPNTHLLDLQLTKEECATYAARIMDQSFGYGRDYGTSDNHMQLGLQNSNLVVMCVPRFQRNVLEGKP